MNGINEAVVLGHLGANPEVKVFQDGGKIVTLSVATGESWNDKDGNKQERTEWHRVVLRNKLADIAEQWLKKGSQVYISGPMKTRKYTDSNNIERYTTEIVGLTLRMIGGNTNNQQQDNQQGGGYNNQMNNQQQPQNNGQRYNPAPQAAPTQAETDMNAKQEDEIIGIKYI